ncbi:MAG: DUF1573 domain-containing protein [Bacteroidales bacterium]|nr:DUF1573 domain-containing protein [Bacteroidales bacterium]
MKSLRNRILQKALLLAGCIGMWAGVSAQQELKKPLKFSETNFDFYSIKEADGVVTHDFLVTNLGETDVKILSTTADNPAVRFEWSKSVLKKYDKVHMKAYLDPQNMRYSFRIPVQVVTLTGKKDTVSYSLRLGGYVVPTPTTKAELYSMQEGNLKYKNNTVSIRRMHRNEIKQDTIWFYNVWDSAMTFKPGTMPPAVKIIDLTPTVGPNEEGYVVFQYSAAAKNDWGSVWDKFTIVTNDPLPKDHHNSKTFYITADIYDDFASWSEEQLQNAPHILIDSEEYNFGQCIIGEVIEHEFTVKNIGKSPLVVHKVKTSCGCTTSNLEKETLLPGESTKIKAKFSTYGKHGGQVKDIYVITNDPDQPKVTLKIIGKVLDKPKE